MSVHHLTSPDGLEYSGGLNDCEVVVLVCVDRGSFGVTDLSTDEQELAKKQSLCKNNHDENFSRLKKLELDSRRLKI